MNSEPTPVGETLAAFLATLAANVKRSTARGYMLHAGEISPAEIRLAEAFARAGLTPEQQYPIGQFNADFCFPQHRVVVEVDGRDFHTLDRDRRRDELLRKAGWRTLRVPASHVRADANAIADHIRHVLDQSVLEETG